MAYYLTIKESKNFKLLDITSLDKFRRISRFKNDSYSLEEIDSFTSIFDNELELKKYLFYNKIIDINDIMKKIEIRIKLNGKLEKVKYGLVYKNMIKYLDFEYLKSMLLVLLNDKNFQIKFLDHYKKSYKQEGLRQIEAILNGYNGNDLNINSAVTQFLIDEITNENIKTGELKVKYRPLHDLVMFIYNFCYYKDSIEILSDNDKLSELKNELINSSYNKQKQEIEVKKRIKKNRTEIDGQISLF